MLAIADRVAQSAGQMLPQVGGKKIMGDTRARAATSVGMPVCPEGHVSMRNCFDCASQLDDGRLCAPNTHTTRHHSSSPQQNISNTAWAFGSLGVPHPAMFAALAAEAKRVRLEGYNSQNVTDLALGFANAGHQVREREW